MVNVRAATVVGMALLIVGCGEDRPPPAIGPGGSGGGGEAPASCDADEDGFEGFACGGPDCDDTDPAINPEAQERCGNAVDDNCDGVADEGCACTPGDRRGCYPEGLSGRNVGICADGEQSCGAEGQWDTCEGAVVPRDESDSCDGIDQDCDGVADGHALNRCGTCGPGAAEVCGNGLDDDCDGSIDPPSLCRLTCVGVDASDPRPAWLACCAQDPASAERSSSPVTRSFLCVEWDGLPACGDSARVCDALDPAIPCMKKCEAGVCRCGTADRAGKVQPHPSCGFDTPCAFLGCEGRTNQPCYSGAPQTVNVGICRAGVASCQEDGGWGRCEGEVVPAIEVCGNGLDDDCDGEIDEADGLTGERCEPARACASMEICGNGLDDDCDGAVDELCPAIAGEQACYRGPPVTRGVGACADGIQRAEGDWWGPCEGDVLPEPERCWDGIDSDCNGFGGPGQREDPGCTLSHADNCAGAAPDACGGCGESPCWNARFDTPADCTAEGRNCQQVVPLHGEVSVLTASLDKRIGDPGNLLYTIEETGGVFDRRIAVQQIDLDTGRVNWVTDLGVGLTRLVQAMPDNSVWVGSQLSVDSTGWFDDANSKIYHVDRHGNALCERHVSGGVEGIAPDPLGYVWVASGYDGAREPGDPDLGYIPRRHLLKLHGAAVEPRQPDGQPWPGGVPRCAAVDLAPSDPDEIALEMAIAPMVLRVDSEGILWGLGEPDALGRPRLLRLDTRTLAHELVDTTGAGVRNLAADGAVLTSRVHWDTYESTVALIPSIGPYSSHDGGLGHELRWRLPFRIEALASTEDGAIWTVPGKLRGVFVNDGEILRLDPTTGLYELVDAPEGVVELSGLFLMTDRNGRLWTRPGNCPVFRGLAGYDPIAKTWVLHCPDDRSLGGDFTWNSDGTGVEYRRTLASVGRWSQVVDADYAGTRWLELDWHEYVPSGTSVEAYVAFADSEAAFDGSPITCGPFSTPPIDLRGCEGQGRRFARIELVLRPSLVGDRPQVSNIEIGWTRP